MLLAGPLLAEFPVPSQGLFSWGHCPYIGSFLWGFSWTVLRLSEGGTQYKFPGQAFTSFPDALCSTSKPLLRKSFILRTQRFSHRTFKWYPGVPLHASMLSHFSRIRLFATTRLLCPRDSPGKNTGVGCHALLQGLRIELRSLMSPAFQAGSLPLVPPGKPGVPQQIIIELNKDHP